MNILAIDPGNIDSAYVVVDAHMKPLRFDKINNEALLSMLLAGEFNDCRECAVEMIACYGMGVGEEVFDTCVWIGRFIQAMAGGKIKPKYIYRREEKMTICGSMKAKDGNIRLALIDKFAKGQRNYGKGTIKSPGFFYGFHDDIWQAFAVAVTYKEMAS